MKISYNLNFDNNNEMWNFAVLVGLLLFFVFWYNILFKGLGVSGVNSNANSVTITTSNSS